MVINVEYNQLDPLLRATGYPDGDANCETGYSPYPGNINQVNYMFQKDNLIFMSLDTSKDPLTFAKTMNMVLTSQDGLSYYISPLDDGELSINDCPFL